jgi:hypothetical protein
MRVRGGRTQARARALGLAGGRALVARLPWITAGLAASIPVISSTVKAVRAGWVPAGDDGIIATRAWDALTAHSPLVGQYSEAGLVVRGQVLHSPGPMLYWLLALPARFGSVTSIAVTMCIVNTLAIIGCVALARRRGGLVLMFATAVGIALMCQSLPGEAIHDIWNPAAGLFPFLLLIFMCWSLACGDYRLLPAVALVASLITQTHLMYAAPTAVLLVVGCGGLLIGPVARRLRARPRARGLTVEPAEPRSTAVSVGPRSTAVPVGPRSTAVPAERRPRIWPWALAAVAVAAVCWSMPAIDELENSPGNLTMIVRTAEHPEPKLGVSVGWHAVARAVGFRPWWLYVPGSEWERKADVRAAPSSGQTDSALALLAALALVGALAAYVRRWDLFAAALIALGLCAAIGFEAASNPSAQLLAETLGYTMWWGSELGLWVWLLLAWSLWLGVLWLARPVLAAVRAGLPAGGRGLAARLRITGVVLASLVSLGAVVAVGGAVARDARPDSHVYEYRPIREVAAGIERVIPPRQTIEYNLGPLDLGTQPMEPAIRFLLVRHGDRPLAEGSYPRLGSYYELRKRPYQWVLYLTDGTRAPRRMRLAGRVRFRGPWGPESFSAWVRRA